MQACVHSAAEHQRRQDTDTAAFSARYLSTPWERDLAGNKVCLVSCASRAPARHCTYFNHCTAAAKCANERGRALCALQSHARHSTLTRLRMSMLGQESIKTETEGPRSERRNTQRLRQTTDLDAADAAEKGGVEREYLFHLRWQHIKTVCRLPKAHAASHMHKHTHAHTHIHWRHFK